MPEKVTIKSQLVDRRTGKVIREEKEHPLKMNNISKEEFFGSSKPQGQMRHEMTRTLNQKRNDGTTIHSTVKPWSKGREELTEIGVDAPRLKMNKTMRTREIKKPKYNGAREEEREEEEQNGVESNSSEVKRALKRNNMFGL